MSEHYSAGALRGLMVRLRDSGAITQTQLERLCQEHREKADRIAALEAELAEAREQAHAEAEAKKLHVHQIITCGIIAEGKEHLNPIYQKGGKWDTAQAEMVRSLRAEVERLRAELEPVGLGNAPRPPRPDMVCCGLCGTAVIYDDETWTGVCKTCRPTVLAPWDDDPEFFRREKPDEQQH